MLSEVTHLQEIVQQLCMITGNPTELPESSRTTPTRCQDNGGDVISVPGTKPTSRADDSMGGTGRVAGYLNMCLEDFDK